MKAKRIERLERRDCEFCGCDVDHRVSQVRTEEQLGYFVAVNIVTCLNCKAIHSERRMVVAK